MSKQDPFIIGVLGGMGTYATIHLFREYAELFPAEKEWERPRILIDNNCTMPSRVRAFLYHEKEEELAEEMAASIRHLIDAGATRILLACNTSHLFLPRVYERVPEAADRVVHIIDTCVEALKVAGETRTYLMATEGTILSGVYQEKLSGAGIACSVPDESEFPLLRECIEAVKQDRYTDEVMHTFSDFLGRADGCACILGCTELPVLYARDPKRAKGAGVYDPLRLALLKIRDEFAAL